MKRTIFAIAIAALLACPVHSEERANAPAPRDAAHCYPMPLPHCINDFCSAAPDDAVICPPPGEIPYRTDDERLAEMAARSAPPPKSLVGDDVNNNGIRDDVDAYIAQHYPEPAQRKAAEQFARAMQLAITKGAISRDAARLVGRKSSEAISCLFERFDSKKGDPDPTAVGTKLIDITVNTRERRKAYRAYSKNLDGTSWGSPDSGTCEE